MDAQIRGLKNPISLALLAVVALMGGAGCASSSGGSGAVAATAGATCTTVSCLTSTGAVGSTTADPDLSSGSSATLSVTSNSTLAQLFYNSNPNSPTNISINIDFGRNTDTVIVSYQDGGQNYDAGFGIVHPTSGISSNEYNGWVSQSGKTIYKGFFQDAYGAVILIVDQFLSQGDGTTGNIVGGSIWFQNFNRYSPNFGQQGPLKMCWEISAGPYDCRSFLVSDSVSMLSSYYPNNRGPDANMNYTKLGTFNGIFASQANFPAH